ncbi:hypothetical protein Kpho02_72850 [Kitasatospora phosalacinea]|uniref:Uncharacterized protein n=1 Tax=Kitasatospora phosalacinea TaxID=2065 RepID=A0A9W6V665_9ACTN|nr:hypothetical protein [Kitasatospora phosalacinea]GLW74988.1 hypothetical protein Kpho02_72850 [Kitasatospora phosalacinea]
MAAEKLVEEILTSGGGTVQVVLLDGGGVPDAEHGPIWRCGGCGDGSFWALTDTDGLIDPLRLVARVARDHAELCTR